MGITNHVSVFPGDSRNLKVGEDSERDCDYLEISLLVNYLKANNSQKDSFHKEDEQHSIKWECLHCKHAQGISTKASFMVVGKERCVLPQKRHFGVWVL